MAETWTIQRVLLWTTDYFKRRALDAPRLTAELLLSHSLGCDRVRLYMEFDRPLNKEELAAFRALVERRAAGEPTFYLLGQREFLGRPFKVDSRVLVPRPETELVTEAALEKLPADAGSVLELCTGSGCIAVSIAAARPTARVVAVDASAPALEVARQNVDALGVADRVTLLEGDLFGPVAPQEFALIVANPPYIASATLPTLSAEVRREPALALDGGPDGLAVYRRLVAAARPFLAPGAWLVLEIGEGQGPALVQLFEAAGLVQAEVRHDLAQLERIALARRA